MFLAQRRQAPTPSGVELSKQLFREVPPAGAEFRFRAIQALLAQVWKPAPAGDNVTLYRGTTGTEGNSNFPLYMTDDPNYARSYVLNGGRVVETTIPRSTIFDMKMHNVLEVTPKPQLHINGTSGVEYKFTPQVKPFIINRLK